MFVDATEKKSRLRKYSWSNFLKKMSLHSFFENRLKHFKISLKRTRVMFLSRRESQRPTFTDTRTQFSFNIQVGGPNFDFCENQQTHVINDYFKFKYL